MTDTSNLPLLCPVCEQGFTLGTPACPEHEIPLIKSDGDHLTGKTLDGRYEILFKLGQGGMGTVYIARQRSTGKKVVIKVISKSLTEDTENVERFKREVSLQCKLEHPNLVNVVDYAESDENGLYFVMEFAAGKPLRKMMKEMGPMPPDLFRELAIQMCKGIAYAHAQGIVHRDLKGDNIIVVSLQHESIVKILDFGIAKAFQDGEAKTSGLTKTGSLLGTPAYMSPEQAKGELHKVGPQSDQYSLGIIFYQMLSGSLPFQADTPWGTLHKHLYEKPPPINKLNSQVPKKLANIVMRCLEKEADKRYPGVDGLMDALQGSPAGKGRGAKTPKKQAKIAAVSPQIEMDTETVLPGSMTVPELSPKRHWLLPVFFLLMIIGGLIMWQLKTRSHAPDQPALENSLPPAPIERVRPPAQDITTNLSETKKPPIHHLPESSPPIPPVETAPPPFHVPEKEPEITRAVPEPPAIISPPPAKTLPSTPPVESIKEPIPDPPSQITKREEKPANQIDENIKKHAENLTDTLFGDT